MGKKSSFSNEKLLKQIVEVIIKYKPAEKIVIFGSRAGERFKDTSDIDIAVFGKNWTSKDINIVKFNLDEYIKTPLKFDLLNFYEITKDRLKENILKKGKVIYTGGRSKRGKDE